MADRDENGHFKKGWKGGPGRPSIQGEQVLKDAMKEAITVDKVIDAFERLYEIGMGGESKTAIRALEVYLAYAVGKPIQRTEITGSDGGPLTWKELVLQAKNDGSEG